MDWNDTTVLVTGADGFVGSHLTERLVHAGARVTALAQYNSFDSHGWLDDLDSDVQAKIKMVRGDVRDAAQMTSICADQDVILHLAALIAIPFSYEAPSSYIRTNMEGTVNVLEGARRGGCRRFVHTSTSEVYGTALFTPITEAHPLQGQSPYSASKIGADALAESYARSFDLPVVTLRPFNTFGPRQSERAVISNIIRQAIDDRFDDICLGDLTPKRDFCFVGDTAGAFMAVAGIEAPVPGSVYNAGTGRMVSIGDVVDAVRTVTGTTKPVIQEQARTRPPESEVFQLMADADKLTTATGWKAEMTLEEGIARTVEWWRGRIDRVRSSREYMR